jgi:hypothetical protein
MHLPGRKMVNAPCIWLFFWIVEAYIVEGWSTSVPNQSMMGAVFSIAA